MRERRLSSDKDSHMRTGRLPNYSYFRRGRGPKPSGAGGSGLRLKRTSDVIISALSIFLLLPAIAAIALIIRVCAAKTVLARPVMLGLYQKPFHRLLFHTDKAETVAAKVEIGSWLAAFNRFLRLTGFDKLPQLFNVLIGDMSIVGPRPHPLGLRLGFHLCEKIIPEYRSRFRVRPGLTGLAQISGTDGSDYSVPTVVAESELDLKYVREVSFWLDLKIIAKTLADELFA